MKYCKTNDIKTRNILQTIKMKEIADVWCRPKRKSKLSHRPSKIMWTRCRNTATICNVTQNQWSSSTAFDKPKIGGRPASIVANTIRTIAQWQRSMKEMSSNKRSKESFLIQGGDAIHQRWQTDFYGHIEQNTQEQSLFDVERLTKMWLVVVSICHLCISMATWYHLSPFSATFHLYCTHLTHQEGEEISRLWTS